MRLRAVLHILLLPALLWVPFIDAAQARIYAHGHVVVDAAIERYENNSSQAPCEGALCDYKDIIHSEKDSFFLMDDYTCEGRFVGSFSGYMIYGKGKTFTSTSRRFDAGKAKSLLIRGPILEGAFVSLHKSENAKDMFKNDRVEILFTKAIPPLQWACISMFEYSDFNEDSGIRMDYSRRSGLDGHVRAVFLWNARERCIHNTVTEYKENLGRIFEISKEETEKRLAACLEKYPEISCTLIYNDECRGW